METLIYIMLVSEVFKNPYHKKTEHIKEITVKVTFYKLLSILSSIFIYQIEMVLVYV